MVDSMAPNSFRAFQHCLNTPLSCRSYAMSHILIRRLALGIALLALLAIALFAGLR